MKADNDKPNCYQCIHRRNLIGNAHLACAHPDACGGKDPFTDSAGQKLGIVGDPHGIRNGWFFWPSNFDPVWLRACNGFTRKGQPAKEASDEG